MAPVVDDYTGLAEFLMFFPALWALFWILWPMKRTDRDKRLS